MRYHHYRIFIGFVVLYGTSTEGAESLGDPFDGNALKNPNWKWKTSDVEDVEPKEWDLSKTKAGWLHVTGELNRNLWPRTQRIGSIKNMKVILT